MKLNTPVEVFEYILNEEGFLEDQEYICICVSHLYCDQFINYILHNECKDILYAYKPNKNNIFSKFTESMYWSGDYSWWSINRNTSSEDLKTIFEQKRLYLKALIKNLKKT